MGLPSEIDSKETVTDPTACQATFQPLCSQQVHEMSSPQFMPLAEGTAEVTDSKEIFTVSSAFNSEPSSEKSKGRKKKRAAVGKIKFSDEILVIFGIIKPLLVSRFHTLLPIR